MKQQLEKPNADTIKKPAMGPQSMKPKEGLTAREVIARYKKAKDRRSVWESHWQNSSLL